MSLITSIRDYVDIANSTEQLDGYTLLSLTYHVLIFLFTVVKEALFYCITLDWLRDLSYFCLTPPLVLSAFTNVNGIGDQPLSHLFAFSDSNQSTGMGLIFIGFFNGCFSCLHLSAAHLVTIQRMLVQGVPAGFFSAFGTAVGQFSFLACVLLGFRGLLFPWFTLEPFHFLVGTGVVLSVASAMAQDKRTVTVQWADKKSLLISFFSTFLLAWCEQTSLFQCMGNLSFGAEPTLLEVAPSFETINSTFGNVQLLRFATQNICYLLAFFLGSVLGAFLIGFLLQRALEFLLRQKGVAIYYGLVKQANLPLATLVFAFGFGSLPYYGFDYLLTKGFGFVPHEPLFQQTFLSPVNLVSKTSQTKEPLQGRLEDQLALLFTLEGERNKSLAVDTTPFDDGQYLRATQKRPQAFEDLNYRGEHLWTNRLSRISNIREQANQTQSSFLGPIFSWMRSFLWGDGSNIAGTEKENTSPGVISSTPFGGTEGKKQEGATINKPGEESNNILDSGNDNMWFKSGNNTRRKEMSWEREQMDSYVKEFDRHFDKGFSNLSDTDSHSLIEVEDQWQEKRIKKKCYTNPIYKFLLNIEIDSFLTRQPSWYSLSPQEEIWLLKKRQLLSNYYDTLSFTNQVSKSQALEQLVPKSYANVIYDHQFKGTLKVARRLFSVKQGSLGGTNNERVDVVVPYTNRSGATKSSRTIKFDQPLFFKENQNVQQILFHEELDAIQPHLDSNFAEQTGNVASQFDNKDSLKLAVEDGKHSSKRLAKPREDKETVLSEKEDIFLLEQAETSPLYAGWDEQLRKFTVTNRYQSRSLAGYVFSGFLPSSKKGVASLAVSPELNSFSKGGDLPKESVLHNPSSRVSVPPLSLQGQEKNAYHKDTIFTTWPIPNPLITKNSDQAIVVDSTLLRDREKKALDSRSTQIDEENVGENVYTKRAEKPLTDKEFLSLHDITEKTPLEYSNAERNSLFAIHGSPFRNLKNPQSNLDSSSVFDSNPNYNDDFSLLRRQNNESTVASKNSSTTRKSVYKPSDQTNDFLAKAQNHVTDQALKNSSYGVINRLKNSIDSINISLPSFSQTSKNHFLFKDKSQRSPETNDMVNALLQWQKVIKENKQLSKEDKQAAKEKISYWPENINRAFWLNELTDNELEVDEPIENTFKKQTFLWEFTPPYHGGFVWSGNNWNI